MSTSNTVKLVAYVMVLRKGPTGVTFAERVDRRAHQGVKYVAYNKATIEAHCASFALDVSRGWDGTDTVPVSIMVDRDPTKRKPRGYDDRPRGFIINAPAGTIVYN